eukprot:scaffold320418_cov31-Tisochrysis_lutea.AAC.2
MKPVRAHGSAGPESTDGSSGTHITRRALPPKTRAPHHLRANHASRLRLQDTKCQAAGHFRWGETVLMAKAPAARPRWELRRLPMKVAEAARTRGHADARTKGWGAVVGHKRAPRTHRLYRGLATHGPTPTLVRRPAGPSSRAGAAPRPLPPWLLVPHVSAYLAPVAPPYPWAPRARHPRLEARVRARRRAASRQMKAWWSLLARPQPERNTPDKAEGAGRLYPEPALVEAAGCRRQPLSTCGEKQCAAALCREPAAGKVVHARKEWRAERVGRVFRRHMSGPYH